MSRDITILAHKGVLGARDRLVGPGMTRGETVLLLRFSCIGAAIAGA
jgi:hypothetical protein